MKVLNVSANGKLKRLIDYERLEWFCIALCGGGWTQKQTAAAMLMASELREGKVVTRKGFILQVVEVEDAAV